MPEYQRQGLLRIIVWQATEHLQIWVYTLLALTGCELTSVTKRCATSSPLSIMRPHSARKFQRATPAVFGLAVMTSTSGLHQPRLRVSKLLRWLLPSSHQDPLPDAQFLQNISKYHMACAYFA